MACYLYTYYKVTLQVAETDELPYRCPAHPGAAHLAVAVSRWNYKLIYPEYAGGVLALPLQTLQQINGYSNRFYGWGGEDDDLWARLERHNVKFLDS